MCQLPHQRLARRASDNRNMRARSSQCKRYFTPNATRAADDKRSPAMHRLFELSQRKWLHVADSGIQWKGKHAEEGAKERGSEKSNNYC